jgi:MFS family permease
MSTLEARPPERRVDWKRRLVLGGLGLLAAFLLAAFLAAFLPRWWAQRVGDLAEGSFSAGILFGLFFGFAFTLVPLAVLWLALRLVHSWKGRGVAVVVAALLASPNLLTLGISIGTGSGAHAGDRILDVEAPGFRWATFFGALAAAACVAAAWYLVASRRRAWGRARRLQARAPTPAETTPTEPPR